MLIIYGALNLGGIETFFVRLAKERFINNKKTKILFLVPRHIAKFDITLLQELLKYSDIYYYEDVFKKTYINWRFLLCHSLDTIKIKYILDGCSQIHVSDIQYGLIANEMLKSIGISKPITFGVYHSMEYTWKMDRLPYFERVNRKFLYEVVDSHNIMCFSMDAKEIIKNRTGYDLKNAKTFRLGVTSFSLVDKRVISEKPDIIKMCAIGRLTDFKTYNFWMPKIINNLNYKGVRITLDIYGDGDSEEKVKKIVSEYSDYVKILPSFNYEKFKAIASSYDLFIGSGTAIIEASSLGVPSIIGIESINEGKTYGFFCDFSKYEYNVMGLPFDLKNVECVIKKFSELSIPQINDLSIRHQEAAKDFDMAECENNFDNNCFVNTSYYKYNRLLYSISKIFFQIKLKFNKKSIYNDFI
ncbi:glycosyltransferase family protein [Acinetobacter bereziniae]|uniref:Glycosyl transferase family 1 domain-containing protein n=1 Tax=Acinetobacter bereziniae NIPH 3 TaxID=1217651 RepID=N8YNA8_ACIBZ|nr:hypothetical protein [Acinetobacter bereziniae]ENV20740.1 hypothetical protein F963_03322 [Acinetobacter bereziniae NIPH 3]MCU4418140.1 hypothetical protein [Acinetobacter bereziniae]